MAVPPRRRTGRPRPAVAAVLVAALVLVAPACLPMPPNSYDPTRFPAGEGPDLVRATTFMGLGAWWDVYDWSPTFTRTTPARGVADLDRLARAGVQVLYLQTATTRHPDTVLDPALLRRIVVRAHALRMRVVGWYLPAFTDVGQDLARMTAAARTGVDGLGIDIESRALADVALRSRRLVDEVRYLRRALPRLPLAAIPVTPVLWDELNRTWWPTFPYRELARWVDVWMPMAYWSYRAAGSPYRDPYRYTTQSVLRLRRYTAVPWLPVHPIGGEAGAVRPADVAEMQRAMVDTHAIGGSLYDDVVTPPSLWPYLRQFRRT